MNNRIRFEIDPHFNEYTHRVIGEYVGGYLSERYGLKRDDKYAYKYTNIWGDTEKE